MSKQKETVSMVKRLIDEWDFKANEAAGIFPDKLGSQSNTYAFWKCKYGHKWRAKINNRYNGRGCPECSKRLKTSFPEQAVFFYLKKKFPDAINSYKDIFKNKMELDVYIPSMKVGVEYDGYAWHKDQSLEKEKTKYKICQENGVFLYRLKENKDHYNNNDKLEVASAIIPVRKPFSGANKDYYYLDYAIKELLHDLFDYNLNDFFGAKSTVEQLSEALYGPKVNTDVNTKRDKNLIYENYLVSLENNSLGTQYPKVAAMWHPTKNGELTPFMFLPHSNVKMWWKGKCGHEWENPITVMTRGQGCPFCSGQRVLKGFNDFATKYPETAKQWHPTKNGDKTPDMFTYGSGHKAYWLCPTCGQTWKAAMNLRSLQDRGCPYCAHEKPIKGVNDLVTLRPDLMKDWDYEKNEGIDPTDLMPNSNKKVYWKCSVCGYRYYTFVANRNRGTGCKKCAGQVLIPGVNDLATLYPEIAKQWDYELNGDVKPSDIFPQTNKNYHWICNKGHRWPAKPNDRVRGTGCPVCSGNKVLEGFNDLATTHPDIAKQWHPTMNGDLKPTQISKGYKYKVWFLCDKCDKAYDSFIGNKIKGFGKCPYCSNKIKSRTQYIEQVETGKRFKTLKEAARSIGKEDYKNIHCCCTGKTKTAFGYHWRYVDENTPKTKPLYKQLSIFDDTDKNV